MIAYLDTSSLVKLYSIETGSDVVRSLVETSECVTTSTIAYAEARATLARQRREGASVRSAVRRLSTFAG